MTLRILFRDEDQELNTDIANSLQEIYKTRRGYFKTIAYDCTNDTTTCPELTSLLGPGNDPRASRSSSQYPNLTFYIPQGLNPFGGKPLIDQHGFGSHVDYKRLERIIDEKIPFMGDNIKDKECLEDWEDEMLNKVIMFGHKKMPPAEWSALSARFKGHLSFAYMRDGYKSAYRFKYTVSELPTVYAVIDGKQIKYDGKMTLQELEEFCLRFAHEELAKVVFRKPGEHDEDKYLFAEVNQQDTYKKKVEAFNDKAKRMKTLYGKPESITASDL